MKRPTAPQVLLILAALLAPIFGGYVANDRTAIDPASFLVSMAEGQAPILQHALLALPVFIALALILAGRRVQQIPYPYVALALMAFVASLAPAVALSEYRAVSVNVWVEWAAYAVAFLACVGGLGRRVGPLALLGAVFAGTAWIARIGVLEYLGNRAIDPTWRAFCNWNNPNAAAAMLVLGFFCALGLPALKERSANLLLNLGIVIGGGLCLGALALTGSKGGAILALPVGLTMFGLVAGRRSPLPSGGEGPGVRGESLAALPGPSHLPLSPGGERGSDGRHPAMYPLAIVVLALSAVGFLKAMPFLGIGASLLFAVVSLWTQRLHVARLGAAFAFAALMLAFFSATTPGSSKVIPSTRMSAAADTQDQSSTFRLNLWKSAATLAKQKPITGWGLGSYRYESARPGLATATVFAHNSYLQLAAEAGLGALALFGTFVVIWTRRTLRGSSRLPDAQRLPFAAAVGGIAAILAHCLVDSDLSYFGLGLSFVLVLGAATVLAADAVAPEFIPPPSRFMAAGGVLVLWFMFAYLAWGDVAKCEVRFAQLQGQAGDVASIEGLAGWDGDAAYLWAAAQPDPIPALKKAYALQPIPKFARRLAAYQARKGDYFSAERTLLRVFPYDPHNLLALSQLIDVQQKSDTPERALETARRLVAVEEGPYFKIRSLDQLVPTETYHARIVLAKAEKDPRAKADLLAKAAEGFLRYAERTVPEVVRATKNNPTGDYAGESFEEAQNKTAEGAEAARTAAVLYRSLKDGQAAVVMDHVAEKIVASL